MTVSSKKIIPVKYTSRDFDSIRSDLVEYAKRYYPSTYKDFSEASFGSLMLDSVGYVGDILSFYLEIIKSLLSVWYFFPFPILIKKLKIWFPGLNLFESIVIL